VNTIEDRLRDAYRAATQTIRPETIPALPERATRAKRSKIRSRRVRVLVPLAAAAAVVAVAAAIAAVTGAFGNTSAGPRPAAPLKAPTGTAYVINSGGGTVTPINLATNTPGKPIKASGEIVAMAIAPDGKTAYVATGLSTTVTPSAQAVQPIDLVTNTAGKPIDLTWPPGPIVITPDGTTAYTINGFPSRTVTPINLATGTPGKSVTLSGEPLAIAMAPDGTAYVAITTSTKTTHGGFRTGNEFMSLDLGTYKLGKPVKLPGEPEAIAFAPDGKAAYVASQPSTTVITVTPIDLTTNTAGRPIDVSTKPGPTGYFGQPLAIAITPDGTTAYLANGASSTVTPINLATGTPGQSISLSGKPGADAIAISTNGAAAYVANQPSSTVTPIDLTTNTPEKPIKIGHGWDSGFEAIATVP
jgi:DNA-binding beta-propeller fold protein YncE